MGCATSKPKVCRHCKAPCSPVRRSYSMQGEAAYHSVALTSSTLGSLKLDPLYQCQNQNSIDNEPLYQSQNQSCMDKDGFGMGFIEAKTWSEMINEKIPKLVPKTPIRTPPGEPETINAWELMEGLEDVSPLKPPHHVRSFSFHVSRNPTPFPDDQPTPRVKDDTDASIKPPWMESGDEESNSTSNDTSIVSEFDPEMISAFRKALGSVSPANPPPFIEEEEYKKKLGKNKVVVYFTSLRGVRKTYEDCCNVRAILKALGVKIDERDVSMHSGFKEELKELLGDGYGGACLPRVFVGKKFIGGADEIRRMHEDGQLEKALEGCERVDGGGCGGAAAGNGGVCESCGDIRFVPCETCSGSCKIYCEADYEDEEEDEEFDDNKDNDDYGFQRCPDCNENGLIRCPICCD